MQTSSFYFGFIFSSDDLSVLNILFNNRVNMNTEYHNASVLGVSIGLYNLNSDIDSNNSFQVKKIIPVILNSKIFAL